MHTVVWLQLGETALAQAEFNRSMHAACYGPFNVRNEVDKHADIPGGHFDNTHFLTGDGGYLQALLNGWGGLRITDAGLRLLQPYLPASVGLLRLRRLAWRAGHLTFTVGVAAQTVELLDGPQLCIVDAQGGSQTLTPGGPPVQLLYAAFAYPAMISAC